jgi:hypothetical protein
MDEPLGLHLLGRTLCRRYQALGLARNLKAALGRQESTKGLR